MNRSIRIIGIVLLAFFFAGSSPVSGADSHVKASLIADVSAVQPGKPFTVGVLLKIDPGWHIYWTNPGDSGMATSVKFKLPENFTIAPDPFPVPRRIQQPGNEVIYGYENTVLITAHLTPPPGLRIGEDVVIRAAAGWLVCKEECLPGKSAVELTLKVADHADPANGVTFERDRSTVTPAGQASPDVTDVKATVDSISHIATISVRWKSAISEVGLFPGADDAVAVSKIEVGKTEDSVTAISLKLDLLVGQNPAADRLPILIAYRDAAGKMRGFETSVPLK